MSAIGDTFLNTSPTYFEGDRSGNGGNVSRLVIEEFAALENHIDNSQPPLDKLLSPFTLGNSDPEQSLMIVLEQLIALSVSAGSVIPPSCYLLTHLRARSRLATM